MEDESHQYLNIAWLNLNLNQIKRQNIDKTYVLRKICTSSLIFRTHLPRLRSDQRTCMAHHFAFHSLCLELHISLVTSDMMELLVSVFLLCWGYPERPVLMHVQFCSWLIQFVFSSDPLLSCKFDTDSDLNLIHLNRLVNCCFEIRYSKSVLV